MSTLASDLTYLNKIARLESSSFYQFVEKPDRCCFCLFDLFHQWLGRPNLTTKTFKKIDTEIIKDHLKRISEVFNKTLPYQISNFKLLNEAILTYNRLVPNHMVNYSYASQINKLIHYAFDDVQFEDSLKPASRVTLEEFLSLQDYLGFSITYQTAEIFQSLGGEIVIIPPLGFGKWKRPIQILARDHLYPVCHQGLVRSKIAHFAATCLKQKVFGQPSGYEKILPPHGIEGGYDGSITKNESLFSAEYEAAFGIPNVNRFGYGMAKKLFAENTHPEIYKEKTIPSKLKTHFNQRYFAHSNTLPFRKIFLSFAETGFRIMERFIEINQNKGPQPLHGIKIVIIPEGDWISYARLHDRTLLKIQSIYSIIPTPVQSPSIQQLEESFWCLYQASLLEKKLLDFPPSFRNFKWPDRFEDALATFVSAAKFENPSKNISEKFFQDYFKILAYRMAFLKFSSLFQPVKDPYLLS